MQPEPQAALSDAEISLLQEEGAKVLKNDEQVLGAYVNVVLAYRLYNTALQAMQRRLGDLNKSRTVEQYLLGAAKHQAKAEFTREELLDNLTRSALPWLAAEIHEQNRREQDLAKSEIQAAETARRETLITLPVASLAGWAYFANDRQEPQLSRKRTLSFAGHPAAVRYVLDQLVSAARCVKESSGRLRPTVVRLVSQLVNHNVVGVREQDCFTIGLNRWGQCGRSVRAIWDTVKPFYSALLRGRIDLCVIYDLANGKEPLASGALPPWYEAGACHRTFRKWADEAGCALIAGVPFESDKPITEHWQDVVLDHRWDQLSLYTNLVRLEVVETSEDTYRIDGVAFNDGSRTCLFADLAKSLLPNDEKRQIT